LVDELFGGGVPVFEGDCGLKAVLGKDVVAVVLTTVSVS
jgi:hypothetical protein